MFVELWSEYQWINQLFWAVAVVATLLLLIRLGLGLYGEEDGERKRFDVRFLLTFIAVFAWGVILTTGLGASFPAALAYATLGGLLAAALFWMLAPAALPAAAAAGPISVLDSNHLVRSTGRVIKSIPPHRNGFGKVHLQLQGASYRIDAVTAGQELGAGAAVRVVDVLDDQVLLVESVETLRPRAPESDRPGRG